MGLDGRNLPRPTNITRPQQQTRTPSAPDIVTMANLSEGAESTNNYIATGIIELAKLVYAGNPDGEEKIKELTEKMNAHSFHAKHKAAITKTHIRHNRKQQAS